MDRYDEIGMRSNARSISTVAVILMVLYIVGGIAYTIIIMSLPNYNESTRGIQVITGIIAGGIIVFGGFLTYLFMRAVAHIMLVLSQIEADLRGGSAHTEKPTPPAHADWFPDPRARAELRYFDGVRWTDQVATRGVRSTDPMR